MVLSAFVIIYCRTPEQTAQMCKHMLIHVCKLVKCLLRCYIFHLCFSTVKTLSTAYICACWYETVGQMCSWTQGRISLSFSCCINPNQVGQIFLDANPYFEIFYSKNPGQTVRTTGKHNIDIVVTVLSTSLRKTFFAWRYILNENILFWLTISNQKPFVFSVSVFCSQIWTLKLILRPKIGLIYAISIVKRFFFIFSLWKYFFFSLLNLNYWCFTTILWKFQKIWTSGTCWKGCRTTRPKDNLPQDNSTKSTCIEPSPKSVAIFT